MKRFQISLLELLATIFVLALIAAGFRIALRAARETPHSLLDKGRGALLYVDTPAE